MGLSFHYSGRFNPKKSLKEMIEEVEDMCKTLNWKYHILDTEFPDSGFTDAYTDDVYGIIFSPPECEAVPLTFLSNGRMSSLINLKAFGNSGNEDYKKYLYMLSVKTQFAGIETHALLIKFFRHISLKYLLDFHISDEGYYWETVDLEKLQGQFNTYNKILDNFCLGLEAIPKNESEDLEDYLIRVFGLIQKGEKK
ncbi:MAG: hypothetical protein PHT69_11175 [Bacteroidales bacterium]|nr:hypothetical protein [Bacteroidales bacterium]